MDLFNLFPIEDAEKRAAARRAPMSITWPMASEADARPITSDRYWDVAAKLRDLDVADPDERRIVALLADLCDRRASVVCYGHEDGVDPLVLCAKPAPEATR